ncbi:hypothetical protein RIF29_15952 [Crotalaria pallida]|uniref:EF-hand domain-containing protein n=1 Tax=Crotalaria pallida TaxID=3830 RepID=A0AAN9IBL6_CROPI
MYLRILLWDIRIKGFIMSIFLYYFQFVFSFISQNWKVWTKTRNCSNCEPVKQRLDCIQSGVRMCKEEVIMVMEKLGMSVECDGYGIEKFEVQEIEQLFENGTSLGEVEEAFNVFDQNKDGFMEARDLLRVLHCLGLEKDLMECQKMINEFDQNGDQLIDRNEFVKVMEKSYG